MVWMSEPDCFLRHRTSAAAQNFITQITRIRIGRESLQRGIVLFIASRRNTFVGGTCALPSALLIMFVKKRKPICKFTLVS